MNALAQDIHYLTITELAGLLRTRALSPVEVTQAQLEGASETQCPRVWSGR